jgi:hypothetical protein
VKKLKTQLRNKEKEKLGFTDKSAGELRMKKITVVEKPKSKNQDSEGGGDDYDDDIPKNVKKKTKVVRQTFAFGGFDQDIYGGSSGSSASTSFAGRNKKKSKNSKENMDIEDWKEFDPTKRLRKGGKIGTSSFKSKKKYKRRK